MLWLHGTGDAVHSVSRLFTNAKSKKPISVPEGQYFLSAIHSEIVDHALINFVTEWAN